MVDYDPYDYDIHVDPYPTYARLREEAPLYRNEKVDFWALSRHADVTAAFRDTRRFSNANGVSLDPLLWGPGAQAIGSFTAMDPPQHTRMRALISRGFTPRRVEAMEPDIRRLARKHLAPALERDAFDFTADFAGLLPMDVIFEMLGVPEADRRELHRLAAKAMHRDEGLADVPQHVADAVSQIFSYNEDLIAERRRDPGDDLVSALLAAEVDGARLTDKEVLAVLFVMFVAGNDTTQLLLAAAWYWAWRNPAQRAAAFAEAGRIPGWVEETLRYDNPAQVTARTLTEDAEMYGQQVPAGARIALLIGAANRDPRAFPDPDRFDIARNGTEPLASFGSGPHFCMGSSLARMEARVALEEVTSAVADYDLDEAGIEWTHSMHVRGPVALPTTVRRR